MINNTLLVSMLKFVGNARQLFAAEHFSRRHLQSGIGFISLHMSFPCMSRFVFSPYFVMQYEGSAKILSNGQ